MISPSIEQIAVINAPLTSMSVMACAGSGKTYTAVKRLIKVRELLGKSRANVALLSFSNVAVETFRKAHKESSAETLSRDRVTIDTFDSFITSNILRPHAHRVMQSDKTPFLISGSETFLKNNKFKFWYSSGGRDMPIQGMEIQNVIFHLDDNGASFKYRKNDTLFDINNGHRVVKNLGKLGAYTHELGKYWALLTLSKEPELLDSVVTKY